MPVTAAEEETVVRLAGRGDGVTGSGRYVPLAAPGDRVLVTGDTVAVEPGPLRVEPPCRHFPECGGCQLQHVGDATYAGWMVERIAYALAQQRVEAEAVEPPHLSPPRSRRRAALRAVKRGGTVVLGFNAEGSRQVVDLVECHVLRPELFALLGPLRALLSGVWEKGAGGGVTLTLTETGIDLLLSNVDPASSSTAASLARFAGEHDLARLSVEGSAGLQTVAERRPPAVRLGGRLVALPPAPFLQATLDGEAALQRAVRDACAGAARVADLFCGVGTFALPLAGQARVHGVDAALPALAALKAAGAGLALATEHRDLFRRPLGVPELARFDAVVFDPPRAGAREQAALLARSPVPRVVAVSCNPATFARDARLLADGGYRLARLWPVGQFRWSTHVELVAAFVRG